MATTRAVAIEINGLRYESELDPRMLLSDFIRHQARLTGTHVGCEHGICGSCTVQVDGRPVRACLMLAVQAEGHSVRTVEALGEGSEGGFHPLQQAFHTCHGLQCGFCTPGLLMSIEPLLGDVPGWDDGAIREALAGNLCRCTGYQDIVAATKLGARDLRRGEAAGQAAAIGKQFTVALPLDSVWSFLLDAAPLASYGGRTVDIGGSGVDFWALLQQVDADEDEHVATFAALYRQLDGPAIGSARIACSLLGAKESTRVDLDVRYQLIGHGSGEAVVERAARHVLEQFAARLEAQILDMAAPGVSS